jgi:hypothetical protein
MLPLKFLVTCPRGENEKVIQVCEINISCTKEDGTNNPANHPIPKNNGQNSAPDAKEQNTIPFPTLPEASDAIP